MHVRMARGGDLGSQPTARAAVERQALLLTAAGPPQVARVAARRQRAVGGSEEPRADSTPQHADMRQRECRQRPRRSPVIGSSYRTTRYDIGEHLVISERSSQHRTIPAVGRLDDKSLFAIAVMR